MLVGWTRRRTTAQAPALRARIVLACAGRPEAANSAIGHALGVHRQTVRLRRERFRARGLAGLSDEPRPRAPRTITDADVERGLATTLEHAPPNGTHWSTRLLARPLGLSQTAMSRI